MAPRFSARRLTAVFFAAALAAGLSACSTGLRMPAAGQQDADRYLFDRGTEELQKRHWIEAREYFRKLVDTYPTSRYRQDAKLGIGDSLLGERRIESDILAASEYREFLRFYPLAARADYAQYQLAVSQVRQVLAPERDQSATRDALKEVDAFLARFPTSQYGPDALKLQRQMKDRLAESEFLVGRHYFRTRWYPGAVARLEQLLKNDPDYLGRDGAYFYLAESFVKLNRQDEARPYYEKLIAEFQASEYLKTAQQRLHELGAAGAAPPVVTTTTGTAAASAR